MKVSSTTHRIGIAGYGLLGRILAWRLARQGFTVSVYEAGAIDPSPAAGATAAGMISPLSEAVAADAHIYQLGRFALDTWPQWLTELTCTAGDSLFHPSGSLLVAHPQDANELVQFEQTLRYKLGDEVTYSRLDGSQLQELAGDLNPVFSSALHLPSEAHIDNRQLFAALHTELLALGGKVFSQTPVTVKPHAVSTARERVPFDTVIDCRGTGAKQAQPQLRGVRGEILHVQTREVTLPCPVRLMHPRYQLYVVPKPNQEFVIGATQIESEDTSPVSLQSTLELGSALYTLAPAFAEARILKSDVNLRPAYLDNHPRVDIQDGLISANGLFRHGYLLAPAVVDTVMGALTGSAGRYQKQLVVPTSEEVL